jgi:hypothetical protein
MQDSDVRNAMRYQLAALIGDVNDGSLAKLAQDINDLAVAIKAVTDKVDAMLAADGAVYQFTANALELGGMARLPTADLSRITSAIDANSVLSDVKTVTDKLDAMLVADGPVSQFTANALELGTGGTSFDPDTILEAVIPGTTYTLELAIAEILDRTKGNWKK